MTKFIEVHNHIINIESISKVEFISDDIFLGDFPIDEDGEVVVDFIPYTFATLELKSGEKIDLGIDLFWLEENESEERWYQKNRICIDVSWAKLKEVLGNITQITGYEYEIDSLEVQGV